MRIEKGQFRRVTKAEIHSFATDSKRQSKSGPKEKELYLCAAVFLKSEQLLKDLLRAGITPSSEGEYAEAWAQPHPLVLAAIPDSHTSNATVFEAGFKIFCEHLGSDGLKKLKIQHRFYTYVGRYDNIGNDDLLPYIYQATPSDAIRSILDTYLDPDQKQTSAQKKQAIAQKKDSELAIFLNSFKSEIIKITEKFKNPNSTLKGVLDSQKKNLFSVLADTEKGRPGPEFALKYAEFFSKNVPKLIPWISKHAKDYLASLQVKQHYALFNEHPTDEKEACSDKHAPNSRP